MIGRLAIVQWLLYSYRNLIVQLIYHVIHQESLISLGYIPWLRNFSGSGFISFHVLHCIDSSPKRWSLHCEHLLIYINHISSSDDFSTSRFSSAPIIRIQILSVMFPLGTLNNNLELLHSAILPIQFLYAISVSYILAIFAIVVSFLRYTGTCYTTQQ